MSKEILLVVDALSNERGIEKEIVISAIESALEAATKKRYSGEVELRVSIDRISGEYQTFRRWLVLSEDEELENEDAQITLDQALEKQAGIAAGDFFEELVESVGFGRIAAQTAKQVIIQKIREAERAKIIERPGW